MDDALLLRYARQILLPQVGIEGQARLRASHALIVGMGGLGTPLALYLAAAGVGHLTLCDDDVVDVSNLPRQILYGDGDLGRSKAECARAALKEHQPGISIDVITARLTGSALTAAVASASVIVDASDNFATRFALSEACVALGKPLVSGAAIRFEGQVIVFRHDRARSPCYRCLYEPGPDEESCVRTGVLGPVTGIVGSLQALEALKILAGFGETLDGRLLLFDGLRSEWREVRLRPDPDCPVCRPAP